MKILVTGGAGFLGRALARAMNDGLLPNVDSMTVFSRDETKQDEMRRRIDGPINYVLGDVCDTRALRLALVGHDAAVHAAAVKYVDVAETQVAEAVRVNIDGSRSFLAAAADAGVPRVVAISTDKAVQPVNAYGMSKALLERLFQAAVTPTFMPVVVRYGNVIGSTGSVIPLFLRQASNGKVTLTDPGMTRFWMTSGEAVAAIQAGLDWDKEWPPVIVPFARSLTMDHLCDAFGWEYGVVGARPGEKPHELLVSRNESVRTHRNSAHYSILPADTKPVPYETDWELSSEGAVDRDLEIAIVDEVARLRLLDEL